MKQTYLYETDADEICLTTCPNRKTFAGTKGIRYVGSWACWTCEHCDRGATAREAGNYVHCLYPDCYQGSKQAGQ